MQKQMRSLNKPDMIISGGGVDALLKLTFLSTGLVTNCSRWMRIKSYKLEAGKVKRVVQKG